MWTSCRRINVAVKHKLQEALEESKPLIVQPVHQDDAHNEVGDGDGKEIGCTYAVRHNLGFVSVTVWTMLFSSLTHFDDGVGVLAIKHQTLGENSLPEKTDMWFEREVIMCVLFLVNRATILLCPWGAGRCCCCCSGRLEPEAGGRLVGRPQTGRWWQTGGG